jgi:hypothetical protein
VLRIKPPFRMFSGQKTLNKREKNTPDGTNGISLISWCIVQKHQQKIRRRICAGEVTAMVILSNSVASSLTWNLLSSVQCITQPDSLVVLAPFTFLALEISKKETKKERRHLHCKCAHSPCCHAMCDFSDARGSTLGGPCWSVSCLWNLSLRIGIQYKISRDD